MATEVRLKHVAQQQRASRRGEHGVCGNVQVIVAQNRGAGRIRERGNSICNRERTYPCQYVGTTLQLAAYQMPIPEVGSWVLVMHELQPLPNPTPDRELFSARL